MQVIAPETILPGSLGQQCFAAAMDSEMGNAMPRLARVEGARYSPSRHIVRALRSVSCLHQKYTSCIYTSAFSVELRRFYLTHHLFACRNAHKVRQVHPFPSAWLLRREQASIIAWASFQSQVPFR